jgi:hypothetical protein
VPLMLQLANSHIRFFPARILPCPKPDLRVLCAHKKACETSASTGPITVIVDWLWRFSVDFCLVARCFYDGYNTQREGERANGRRGWWAWT